MRPRFDAMIRCAVLVFPLLAAAEAAPARRPPAEDRVSIALVSELEAVRPGARFLIGLRFEIEEHWHIYWENAGESGMPTRAELEAPVGFHVDPALFPGPELFELPGDIESYGYSGQTMLFFVVQAPEDLAAGRALEFQARASWLVCKEACFLGDGKTRLTLQSVAPSDEPAELLTNLLEPHRTRLPRPLTELAGAEARWEGEPGTPVLCLDLPPEPGAELAYFPAEELGLELMEVSTEAREGGGRTLSRAYRFRPRKELDLPRARAVIGVGEGAKRRFYELDRAWPAEAAAGGGGERRD